MNFGENDYLNKVVIMTKFYDDWTKKCGFFDNVQFFNVGPFFDSDFTKIKKRRFSLHGTICTLMQFVY